MRSLQDSIVTPINTVAPAALAVLADTGILASGWYKVVVRLYLSGAGTPVAADADNAKLQVNLVDKAIIPVIPVKDIRQGDTELIFRAAPNSSGIRLLAIGAATATVAYRGSLIVTRIGD